MSSAPSSRTRCERIAASLRRASQPSCCTASPAAARPRSICISSPACSSAACQALVLVPEISLTPQLEARFRERLSRGAARAACTAASRTSRAPPHGSDAARGEAGIVLGTRLAVLAPLPRLGLVVVDEEHDTSFKQQEGLRYSARDAGRSTAAKLAGCPVVLGTRHAFARDLAQLRSPGATSASSCRARRARRAPAGSARCSTCSASLRPSMACGASLLDAIGERLASGEQSLDLHQPARLRAGARLRGLRLDRGLRALHRAHGAALRPTARQPALPPLRRRKPRCRAPARPAATSTSSRWAAARSASRRRWPRSFPRARIVRIDRDSARRRGELARTLEGVRRGEGDILVGTQLLAKGHDFPNLDPGRRAERRYARCSRPTTARRERLFAVLAQVAGRAGRREQPGEVLVQTRYPGHPLYRRARARTTSRASPQSQLAERKRRRLPAVRVRGGAARRGDRSSTPRCASCADAAAASSTPESVRVYDPVPHVITRRAGFERAQLLMQSRFAPRAARLSGRADAARCLNARRARCAGTSTSTRSSSTDAAVYNARPSMADAKCSGRDHRRGAAQALAPDRARHSAATFVVERPKQPSTAIFPRNVALQLAKQLEARIRAQLAQSLSDVSRVTSGPAARQP